MRSTLACAGLLAFCVLPACSRKPATEQNEPKPSPAASTQPVASATAQTPVAHTTSYAGTYNAKPATVAFSKADMQRIAARDKGTEQIGAGTIEFSLVGSELSGRAAGPLGPMVLRGFIDGPVVRANATPVEPQTPAAMTGVLLLTSEASGYKGTLRVSGPDGEIVREAAVQLAPKP